MNVISRRLAGTFLLIIFLALYAFVMFVMGTAVAVHTTSRIAALSFYAIAGLAWVVPAGWIVKWMYRPHKTDQS